MHIHNVTTDWPLKRMDEMDEENRKLREQNAAMSDKLDRILEQLNK